MKKIGRRRVLQGSAAVLAAGAFSVDPLRSFFSTLLRGVVASARRRGFGGEIEARNYLNIHMYGSPARYIFDNPLKPWDGDGFVPHPQVMNRLNAFDPEQPSLTSGTYEDVKVLGVNMPYLWNFQVPSAKGGDRPLADLARHMMIVRGCDMHVNGHPGNSGKLVAPVPGGTSMTGLVAERSRAPIPALSLGRSPASRAYRSPRGVPVVELPPESSNYAQSLLEAFESGGGEILRDQKLTNEAIEDALEELQGYSRGRSPGSEVVDVERKNADRMIRRGVADLAEAYPPILAKYQELVNRTFYSARIPGVTDKPVPGVRLPCSVSGNMNVRAALGTHRMYDRILCPTDYVATLMKGRLASLASEFAIAEFALTQQLSSSVLIAPPNEMGNLISDISFAGVRMDDIVTSYDPRSNRTTFSTGFPLRDQPDVIPFDTHFVGTLPNLIACTIYYQALGTCMIEIIDRLKETNKSRGVSLFDETVVHLSSEFERLPSQDGADSDHSFKAHMTSVFSGIIKEPTVLGNIFVGSKEDSGTVGIAAPVKGLRNGTISIGNVSSTLSQLLRVPPIIERAQPLVNVEGDKITPTIEIARNVEGRSGYEDS